MRRSAENSKRAKNRPRGKPFPKGKSPNPGGRPKSAEANALIRRYFDTQGEKVIDRLYTMAQSKDARLALGAIREILDRNLGRPAQAVQVDLASPAFMPAETVLAVIGATLVDHPDALRTIEKKRKKLREASDG
jgi:hypothetical protein